MICPACELSIQNPGKKCPDCHEDLTPLIRLDAQADTYYNKGLDACKEKDWLTAIEKLSAALALKPLDVDAMVLLGKVYIEMNEIKRSCNIFSNAYKIDNQNREVKNAILWLSSQGYDLDIKPV